MRVKCVCGDPMCRTELTLDTDSGLLIMDRNNTAEPSLHIGMYLDANGAVAAVRGLKAFLLAQADKVSV